MRKNKGVHRGDGRLDAKRCESDTQPSLASSSSVSSSSSANLNLYVSGENLLTWTGFKGADPESVGTGYDETYPNARSFTLGLNVSF